MTLCPSISHLPLIHQRILCPPTFLLSLFFLLLILLSFRLCLTQGRAWFHINRTLVTALSAKSCLFSPSCHLIYLICISKSWFPHLKSLSYPLVCSSITSLSFVLLFLSSAMYFSLCSPQLSVSPFPFSCPPPFLSISCLLSCWCLIILAMSWTHKLSLLCSFLHPFLPSFPFSWVRLMGILAGGQAASRAEEDGSSFLTPLSLSLLGRTFQLPPVQWFFCMSRRFLHCSVCCHCAVSLHLPCCQQLAP